MKLHRILISLILVNALALSIADYVKSVFLTNKHVELAYKKNKSGLKTVIKNIVTGNATMEKISLMLAVPECTRAYADVDFLQEVCSIADQNTLQAEITRVTSLLVPQGYTDEEISGYTLPYLGNSRRKITKELTKSLVFAAISKAEPQFDDFPTMCRLLGLFRCISFPGSFIQFAEVNSKGVCTLTSRNNILVTMSRYKYRMVNGIIAEVHVDRDDEVLHLLSAQLNLW
ncbi:uncharacterized protein LOC126840756 isoform X1 [Adelges cooleyi]|uniref:uncharacterized protein LOC126840756 isoform X1 n=1 Tax=Adelges cooleyi TaxID=133065 RepID=UPI00217FE901|nr:uncharacterized protein LOC126840756 isoform X1 [Adelges cooleyi]XP_050432647.1 uncharacterized protein LOC126840756 isoform X1 [Adelges cooleyi]